MIDTSEALASAVRAVFDHPVVHRCQFHKVPKCRGQAAKARGVDRGQEDARHLQLRRCAAGRGRARDVARQLELRYPGAAGSLREGLAETFTVVRLEVPPSLARTMRSTNAIESTFEISREHSANVKRWRDGPMALRWYAAGIVEAEKQFRRVNGFMHMPALRTVLYVYVATGVTPRDYSGKEEAA